MSFIAVCTEAGRVMWRSGQSWDIAAVLQVFCVGSRRTGGGRGLKGSIEKGDDKDHR